MLRASFCGLCDDCQLGDRGFLDTVARLQGYLSRFRANWWIHCFPGEECFSLPELHKGLDWFRTHSECPGCKGGRGHEDCPIRLCAMDRGLDQCYQCPDLKPCNKFDFLVTEFPDLKARLRRRQLKYSAQELHRRLETKGTGK
ncbi:MAG: hypothetical protein A2Z73_03170 [Deltaproteobacteria bacterium RBG_13_60_28]|nr:MAG: hypothetical protein A2Z73_03170 [Deltaproteobacteria bacterium RBG_13_60_28]